MITLEQGVRIEDLLGKDPSLKSATIAKRLGLTKQYVDEFLAKRKP